MNSLKSPIQERGSVLIEAAMVLPLLFLILFGIVGLGRRVSQIPWISQTLYNSALHGSDTHRVSRNSTMDSIEADLVPLQDAAFRQVQIDNVPQENSRFIKVRMNGEVSDLVGHLFAQSLGSEMTFPVLVRDSLLGADINRPLNPETLYDCNGEPVFHCSSSTDSGCTDLQNDC